MQGLYLYCIRPQGAFKLAVTRTISEDGEVDTIPHQDIEAIVSKVDAQVFTSEEVQKKAAEDLGWIKEMAERHEYVTEEAMRQGTPVIPMKFGTVFYTRKKLEETLQQRYAEFKAKLAHLSGKQEWAVKVYLNRKPFQKEVRITNARVKEKEKELGIASAPEGLAYFLEKQLENVVSEEAEKELQEYRNVFLEKATSFADRCTKGKILEKELTGKSLPMILNVILLVQEKNISSLKEEVSALHKQFYPKGFRIEQTGPWPPYHFV